ncbi:MAG: NEW3 domain-containing protein [Suilimivivens sp.]
MLIMKGFKKKIWAGVAAALMMGMMLTADTATVHAAEGLEMSTDYPGITVKAGESVNFTLDFSSISSCDATLSVEEMPDGWTGYFRGNSGQISRVHINAGGGSSATFNLTLPDDTQEGSYKVILKAEADNGNTDLLELRLDVNEVETGESNFTAEYPEQEGASGTSFSFDATIVNNRGVEQSYSLSANAPSGWEVSFTPSGESSKVASMTVDAGTSAGLTVKIVPPESITEGEYTIPCSAISANETLKMELNIRITGLYDVELTTPSGRLSFDAHANEEKAVTLSVKNNGNVDLENLNLTSSAPSGWEVRFDESTIEVLEAGSTKEVTAYIKPDSDAMTGDYLTTLRVSNDETSSEAEFRVSVKIKTTWGVFAVAIIVLLLGGLGFIFKKYGRR